MSALLLRPHGLRRAEKFPELFLRIAAVVIAVLADGPEEEAFLRPPVVEQRTGFGGIVLRAGKEGGIQLSEGVRKLAVRQPVPVQSAGEDGAAAVEEVLDGCVPDAGHCGKLPARQGAAEVRNVNAPQ